MPHRLEKYEPGRDRSGAQDLRREQLTTHGLRSLPKQIDSGRLPEHLRTRRAEIVAALGTPEGALGELEQIAVKAVLVVEAGDAWLAQEIAKAARFEDLRPMLQIYDRFLNTARRSLETVYVLRQRAGANVIDLDAEMQRLAEKRAAVKSAAREVVDHDSE
jgi:hypothetical protein